MKRQIMNQLIANYPSMNFITPLNCAKNCFYKLLKYKNIVYLITSTKVIAANNRQSDDTTGLIIINQEGIDYITIK